MLHVVACCLKFSYYILLQAVCCSDHKTCCPNGYVCNPAEKRCDPAFLDLTHIDLTDLTDPNPLCPDGTSTCPAGSTCCQMESGGYGCCPYKDVSPHLIYL